MIKTPAQEKWVSKNQCVKECGISYSTLRWRLLGKTYATRTDPRDTRKILVNLYEIKRIIGLEDV